MREFRAFGATAAFALTMLLSAAQAGAQPAAASRTPAESPAAMTVSARAPQPIGHHDFCRAAPEECGPRADRRPVAPIALDARLIARIASLNVEVNSAITAASDAALYGVEERWVFPDTHGDCEDYALLKRRRLAETGIDPSNLLLTVVRKADGTGHAVLTLVTTRGDFVLDNLDWRVKLWSETPYTFVKRQDPHHSGRWRSIEPGEATVVSATEAAR